MIDHHQLQRPPRGLAAGGRLIGLRAGERQRLERTARIEPRALLGVVEYWLAEAEPEGQSRVDS